MNWTARLDKVKIVGTKSMHPYILIQGIIFHSSSGETLKTFICHSIVHHAIGMAMFSDHD
jgi:hypothetical protein